MLFRLLYLSVQVQKANGSLYNARLTYNHPPGYVNKSTLFSMTFEHWVRVETAVTLHPDGMRIPEKLQLSCHRVVGVHTFFLGRSQNVNNENLGLPSPPSPLLQKQYV
eukprot:s1743_g16.t1